MAMYEHHDWINSSVAEQLHSKLQNIREQVSSMRQETFMEYVRHFLYLNNVKNDVVSVKQVDLHS